MKGVKDISTTVSAAMEMMETTTSTRNPSTVSNGDTLGFHQILSSATGRPDLGSLASVLKLIVRGVIHAVEASRNRTHF